MAMWRVDWHWDGYEWRETSQESIAIEIQDDRGLSRGSDNGDGKKADVNGIQEVSDQEWKNDAD